MKITEPKTQNGRMTQSGFTLMEIVVATAIFATVVASTLALFNTVLRINREVQAIRLVAQTSRNFTEVLSREIRNGRIDYSATAGSCPIKYSSSQNQALAITTYSGEKLCFRFESGDNSLYLDRTTSTGTSTEAVNPTNMIVDPDSFRFMVRPTVSPTATNNGIQPMVTILAEFVVNKGTANEKIIPYQSTISTDVYDLPNQNN